MDALSTPQDVEALADQLVAAADASHERIRTTLKVYRGAEVPPEVQAQLRALFDEELLLRQRADGLYANLAAGVVRLLGEPQAHLTRLTQDAAGKIRTLAKIADAVSVAAALAGFAGAVATGKPDGVATALEKLYQGVQHFKSD